MNLSKVDLIRAMVWLWIVSCRLHVCMEGNQPGCSNDMDLQCTEMYHLQHGDTFIRNVTQHNHSCDPGVAIRSKARAVVSSIIYTQFDLNYLYLCIFALTL